MISSAETSAVEVFLFFRQFLPFNKTVYSLCVSVCDEPMKNCTQRYGLYLWWKKKFQQTSEKQKTNVFIFVLFFRVFPSFYGRSKPEQVECCSNERTAFWVQLQKLFLSLLLSDTTKNWKNAAAVAAAAAFVIILPKTKYFWNNNHL